MTFSKSPTRPDRSQESKWESKIRTLHQHIFPWTNFCCQSHSTLWWNVSMLRSLFIWVLASYGTFKAKFSEWLLSVQVAWQKPRTSFPCNNESPKITCTCVNHLACHTPVRTKRMRCPSLDARWRVLTQAVRAKEAHVWCRYLTTSSLIIPYILVSPRYDYRYYYISRIVHLNTVRAVDYCEITLL